MISNQSLIITGSSTLVNGDYLYHFLPAKFDLQPPNAPKHQEGVSGPEQVTPEEIDDWSQGPSRIQAKDERIGGTIYSYNYLLEYHGKR